MSKFWVRIVMLCVCGSTLVALTSVKRLELYSYDDGEPEEERETAVDYGRLGNGTEDGFETFEGREEDNMLDETRQVYPLNHKPHLTPSTDLIQELAALLNFQKLLRRRPIKPARKGIIKRKRLTHLLPLLLIALSKAAQLLPIVKLTLLTLFALVLFSKKALLVSIGSLILVLYDSFYKHKNNIGVNIVKDRGTSVVGTEHEINTEEHRIQSAEDPWYEREEFNRHKMYPREDLSKGEKWKRWWAPQVNHRRKLSNTQFDSRESRRRNGNAFLYENVEDVIII